MNNDEWDDKTGKVDMVRVVRERTLEDRIDHLERRMQELIRLSNLGINYMQAISAHLAISLEPAE